MEIDLGKVLEYSDECLRSRSKLRSVMSDMYPGKTLEMNVLLAVYDSGIPKELKKRGDVTPARFQASLQKVMKEHGLQEQYAKEGIREWTKVCLGEEALKKLPKDAPQSAGKTKKTSGKRRAKKAESGPESQASVQAGNPQTASQAPVQTGNPQSANQTSAQTGNPQPANQAPARTGNPQSVSQNQGGLRNIGWVANQPANAAQAAGGASGAQAFNKVHSGGQSAGNIAQSGAQASGSMGQAGYQSSGNVLQGSPQASGQPQGGSQPVGSSAQSGGGAAPSNNAGKTAKPRRHTADFSGRVLARSKKSAGGGAAKSRTAQAPAAPTYKAPQSASSSIWNASQTAVSPSWNASANASQPSWNPDPPKTASSRTNRAPISQPQTLFSKPSVIQPGGGSFKDYQFRELGGGEVEITKFVGVDEDELIIPGNIDGKRVVGIGKNAFRACWDATILIVPEQIRYIENGAFSDCRNLKVVRLPSSLERLGGGASSGGAFYSPQSGIGRYDPQGAFARCRIEAIVLPASLQSIGEDTFFECDKLKEITLPSHIRRIPNRCFYGCASLQRVKMPDGVAEIGEYAFARCRSLENFQCPSGLSKVGKGAFRACDSLSNIWLNDRLSTISEEAFLDCSSLKEIRIPSSVRNIEAGAFQIHGNNAQQLIRV
ncbi:MAG: leucine-rich repeat protein [Lachnospiraceae bacterium]|nr:leucine-rich repeat protein [Lachnospiraceae bacterium]